MRSVYLAAPLLTLITFVSFYRHSFVHRTNPTAIGGSTRGSIFFDRWRAQNGYNVIAGGTPKSKCRVFAMDGRMKIEFPAKACIFLENQNRLVLNEKNQLKFIGSQGAIIWTFELAQTVDWRLHYRSSEIFVTGSNGEILILDSGGAIAWQWNLVHGKAEEYSLAGDCDRLPDFAGARTEPDSAGDLVVNLPASGAVLVVDRKAKRLVWKGCYRSAPPPGSPVRTQDTGVRFLSVQRDGSWLTFKPRMGYLYKDATFSAIEELSPRTNAVNWRYLADPATDFYFPAGGEVQPLANGNVLFSSSKTNQAFEVTRKGRIVWEWIGPATIDDESIRFQDFSRVESLPE